MDCIALACFHQVKIKNSSLLAEIPPLGAFSRFDTHLHPSNKSLHRLQSFLKSLVMHINSHVTFLSNY